MILTLKIAFWILLALLFYTYVGYGLVLAGWVWLRRRLGLGASNRVSRADEDVLIPPRVALVIPAYNERACIEAKWNNSHQLDYPAEYLRLVFVTEGSNDGTTEFLEEVCQKRTSTFPQLTILSGAVRRGKVEAINQAMDQIKEDIVVFTDANTTLNSLAIRNLVRHFQDPKVGAVAGEKRIKTLEKEALTGAGEGLYWKYESLLKRLDTQLHSVVGAAGELFAIRPDLFRPVEKDILLDDFVITLRIAQMGYRVVYEPEAYALERPSLSLTDEKKRKVRIATGGFQAMWRLRTLFDLSRHPLLSFQFVSHRALRWVVAPFALVGVWLLSGLLMHWEQGIYTALWVSQLVFYGLAALGYWLETQQRRSRVTFVPFYFSFMHWCVLLGLYRYLAVGVSSGIWEKVPRAAEQQSFVSSPPS